MIEHQLEWLPGFHNDGLWQQGREEHGILPLPVLELPGHGDPPERAEVFQGGRANPAHLASRDAGVIEPLRDGLAQFARPLTRIVFAVELIASLQGPVDIVDAAAPASTRKMVRWRRVASSPNTASTASTRG